MSRIEYFYVKLNQLELYLDDEQLRLGTFFDLGINECGLSGQYCAELFIRSGLASAFEQQVPKYVAGMSGTELLLLALDRCGVNLDVPNPDRWPTSPDYWVGYSLPCFQLATGYSYERLFEILSYDDIRGLHYRYCEKTEDDFVQAVLDLIGKRNAANRLKERRKQWHITQAELADLSGVSLRSIQLYEQGEKDLNRAAADTVRRLSLVLRCKMEDLLEMGPRV